MPARSKSQLRYMQMMAHNPNIARKPGDISPEAAKEYVKGNKGKYRFSALQDRAPKKK